MELRQVRQHIDLVRSSKDRITRNNTRANRSSDYYDEKQPRHHQHHHHHHHRRPHSVDRYSEYTRYEEKQRRPKYDHGSHHNPHLSLDTDKAQREYYYSHALPSPYKGEIEYTPLDGEFDEGRGRAGSERRGRGRRHGGDRKEEVVSQSSSTVDRGRNRSRSVHQERRVRDSSADADSEAEEVYEKREYFPKGARGGGRPR